MIHPSAVGVLPRATDGREHITYTSVESAVESVIAERLAATSLVMTRDDQRYFWPGEGRIFIYMSDLPLDCGDIIAAIRHRLETADDDGYVMFPVKAIRIDRESGLIQVTGDERRITHMRPLPS